MKIFVAVCLVLLSILLGNAAAASEPDPFCLPIRRFVASVDPGDVREFAFHTSWGSNFKNAKEPAFIARQCQHEGYAPARLACQVLMEDGAVEFSNTNAERVVVCLAPDHRWGEHVHLEQGSISLDYGTDDRGSNVSVSYGKDNEMGGMVLRVSASGY